MTLQAEGHNLNFLETGRLLPLHNSHLLSSSHWSCQVSSPRQCNTRSSLLCCDHTPEIRAHVSTNALTTFCQLPGHPSCTRLVEPKVVTNYWTYWPFANIYCLWHFCSSNSSFLQNHDSDWLLSGSYHWCMMSGFPSALHQSHLSSLSSIFLSMYILPWETMLSPYWAHNICEFQHHADLLPIKNTPLILVLPWCKPKVGQPCFLLNSNSHTESNVTYPAAVLPALKSLAHTNDSQTKNVETLWRSLTVNYKHKCCKNKPLLPTLWSTIQNSPGW